MARPGLEPGDTTIFSHEFVSVAPDGFEAQADWTNLRSPETYLGYFAAHARTKASVRSQLMQVYVQKSTRTTLPRSSA